MIKEIYTLKDIASGAYLTPFYTENFNTAVREMNHTLSGNNLVSENAKDFDLYKLGTYDTDTGMIEPIEIPTFVFNLQDFINETQEVK
jgi:hypothetical protein